MTNRSLWYSLFLQALVGLGIGLVVFAFSRIAHVSFLEELERWTVDYRFQQRGTLREVSDQGNVVIVNISEKDLTALPEAYPFPRSYYAHVLDNLNRAGARTIVLDRIFDSPGPGDDSLRAVLQRYDNVILAVKAPPAETEGKYLIRSISRDYSTVFYSSDQRVGAVNLPLDPDNVVRRYFPSVWSNGYLTPSLAFAALNQAYRLGPDSVVGSTEESFTFGDREIPKADEESFLLNYYGPPRSFRFVPFSHVIDDPTFWTRDELDIEEQINTFDENLMRAFSNKVVIIGSSMAEERDRHFTPLKTADGERTMEGAEIHATAIQNVIDRSFVQPSGEHREFWLLLFLSVVTVVTVLAVKRLPLEAPILLELVSILVVLLFVAGVVELAVLQFNNQSLLMGVVNPTMAILAAYVGTIVYVYVTARQQKSVIQTYFSPYLNQQIVDALVAHPAMAKLRGDQRPLTVLVADIADFSTISQPMPPEKLVLFLQEYREELVSIILAHGGTLDGFEGDAILAFWGAPVAHNDHALRACMASLEIQKRLEDIRNRWQRTGKPAVEVRIGIASGEMVFGNMGGKSRFDYSVIGESVNVARRLERANKVYRSRIILSDVTYAQVRNAVVVRELDVIRIRNHQEPLRIWELLTAADSPIEPLRQEALDAYQNGLQQFRNRQWNDAIQSMQQAKALDPTLFVADLYEQRALHYKLNPPEQEWNGVSTVPEL